MKKKFFFVVIHWLCVDGCVEHYYHIKEFKKGPSGHN